MALIGNGNSRDNGVFVDDLDDIDESNEFADSGEYYEDDDYDDYGEENNYKYDQDETNERMRKVDNEDEVYDDLDYDDEVYDEFESEDTYDESDEDVEDEENEANEESKTENEKGNENELEYEYTDGDESYSLNGDRLNELIELGIKYDDRVTELGDLSKEDIQLMNDIKKGDMLAVKKAIGDMDINDLFDTEGEWEYKEKVEEIQIARGYDEEGYNLGTSRLNIEALSVVDRPEELNNFLKEDKKNGDVIYNKALKRAKITGIDKKEAYAYEIGMYYKNKNKQEG